jgi:tRNA pseudouridine55 synthase
VTAADVADAAASFVGEIEQVPPMVSAVKVGGVRLHELARKGIEVDREARRVTVHRFDVSPTADPLVYEIEVVCSSGTYVRSLAADVGVALGGGAHLRMLRRTAIGSFRVDDALSVETVGRESLLPPSAALRDYPSVVAADQLVVAAIGHGKVLGTDVIGVTGDGPWAVLDAAGRLLAVYERYGDDSVKPAVVLVPA